MRTKEEIFKGEDPQEFLIRCHPINGIEGFKLFFTRVLGYQMKPFHEEWIGPLCDGIADRIAIAAPTGFGKSSLFGIGYSLWNMWFNNFSGKGSWSGLIITTSLPLSKQILQRIKNNILNNELLVEAKPTNTDKSWSKTDIELRNGTSLMCRPLNENVQGYHVNYIFADEVASFHDRSCFFNHVSTRVNSKKGQLAAVSTYENEFDLLHELQALDKYYNVTTSAIVDGKSIWPERFSYEYLMEKKAELGENGFALQYLSDASMPLDDLTHPFPLSLLARNSDPNFGFESEKDEGATYYIGYDPAFSYEGDYNAMLLAKQKEGKIYLCKIKRFKGDPDEAIAIIKGWANKFYPNKVVVDTNSGGSKVLRDMSKFNLPVVGFPFDSGRRWNAFKETISTFHGGDIILPQDESDPETINMMQEFFKEMTHISSEKTPGGKDTFKSHTKHDDIAMAFIMLIDNIPKVEGSTYIKAGRYKRKKKKAKKKGGIRKFKILTN